MSDPRSKELIKLRGSIKGKLTIFQNFINSLDKCDHISETQYNELECRLSKIDSLQNDFDKFQTELEILSDDTSQLLLEREEFDTKYFSLVAEARTIMNRSKRHLQRRMSVSEASEGSESRDGGFHDFVRLPKISLPSFDGEKMTQWLEFRDTYLSLIHSNNNLGNINKFHYLRAALKGSALTVIKNLEFTSKNYEVAWQLLSSRYDNERLLVNIHVNSLLNFSTMTKESGKSLRNLVDTINRNLCALNTLGQPTDHWDTLVIHLMSRKLDSVTFREWEEHRNSITTSPTLKQFIDFLIGRADLLDTIQLEETQRQSTSQINQNTQFTQNKHITQSKNTSLNKEKITLKTTACPLCTQNHFLFSCSEFRKLSVDERLEKMKNFSVCKNCLRPGHKDSQCRLTHCKYCSLKHSTLLHKDTEQHTTVALSANIQTSNKPLTLLSTALVNVVGADGKLHPARALLDNASTGHYVTQHLCEKLGLLRQSVSSSVTGINNQLSYVAESCTLPLESYSGDFKVNLECHVLPQITNTLPSCNIDIRSLKLPPHIRLADPSFHISSPIDILVGADVFWDVICSDFIDLGKQCPKLQKTKLGWLVSGTIKAYTQSHKNKAHQSSCFFTQRDDALLTRFWELESVSSKYNLTLEEQACEKSFAENTRRDTDGRFIVTIPLKESPEVLGDNYHSAKNRLLALERRFQRDSVLKKRYYDFMTEYRDLGHMSDTVISKPTEPDSQNRYYLPHFPIIRENSTTTKCRVVFNASALNKGKTFNSIQMVGPVVQDDLLSILLRFRQHKYVVSGDIEKMYRAILVEPTQRSLQQILFRFDPSEHIRPFTLNTVTYGTASAPYLATKCLVSLGEQCSDPNAKIAISRDFYVDDFISGGDSIESVTIPRLELCGALLASRLHAKVMSSITLKVHNSFFWTDSTIVLAWLKTQSNQLKTFVRTRVGEIQDSTAGHRWSYVPSKENPADLVSRGIATNSIGSCALWWSGPDFLKTKNIQFPIKPNTQSDSTSTQRQEKTEIVLHTTTQSKDTVTHIIHELINKTSSYTHLIRSFAFVQRFIHNCKYPKNKLTQTLSTTELKNSETYILKLVQQQMFKDEYILLKSEKPLPYKNRLSSLAPFIHSDELIRVGGRLKNSHYPFDIKHPILLCGKHHLTQILFQKEHISLMHAGPQLLLSFIRQKYWPLGGRNLARRVVHRCVRCCRFKPKPIQPMMSDLPADRTRLEFPFLHTGIDYAGPIMIASRKGRGAKLEKSYICIFVCFAVKALHLELVTDLTKEAFISAFLKFISRRGKPMSVTSDNSTTFIGASNEIASFFSKYSDDIKSDLSNRDIEFRRIPQYTPHFGGLWESAVKSVKFHLKRILNLTHLTYEEMTTCLVQIEAILNSRPLTPLSSDPSDLTCLTPAHFLIGRSLLSVPRPMVSDTNIAAMDRYQRIEALKQHFWRRFSAEYVSLLQQRMKWQRGSITSLQLGSLVLVKDRAQPPLLWLLGRVEKVHPGQDGVARVAEIKTKKGVITRAFNNICPLPISNSRGQDV